MHLVWNDRQAYGCYACNWDLLWWAPYKFSIYSNFCMLSLTIYSIDMKKRKSPSWKKKNGDTMCVLDYMKSSKIPNLQLFHLLREKKKMKFLRMCKFSVMPEIFQYTSVSEILFKVNFQTNYYHAVSQSFYRPNYKCLSSKNLKPTQKRQRDFIQHTW